MYGRRSLQQLFQDEVEQTVGQRNFDHTDAEAGNGSIYPVREQGTEEYDFGDAQEDQIIEDGQQLPEPVNVDIYSQSRTVSSTRGGSNEGREISRSFPQYRQFGRGRARGWVHYEDHDWGTISPLFGRDHFERELGESPTRVSDRCWKLESLRQGIGRPKG